MLTVVTNDDARVEDAAAGRDEIAAKAPADVCRRNRGGGVRLRRGPDPGELDEHGHRLVVRNGHAEARTIVTTAGGSENPERPEWTIAR